MTHGKEKAKSLRLEDDGKAYPHAEEVLSIIERREVDLLKAVKEYGMTGGYRHFALAVNEEYTVTGESVELPVDWKWISKKLGDRTGKNLHTGGGFQALRLSDRVRYEMTRVLQARPIYPSIETILSNSFFRECIISHLGEWQGNENSGGFHVALSEFIGLWNSDPEGGEKHFFLPTALFPNDRQEDLASILGLSSYSVEDFLQGFGLPKKTWHKGYDAYKLSIKAKNLLIKLCRRQLRHVLRPEDFDIIMEMVVWTPKAREKYKTLFDPKAIQRLYITQVQPIIEADIESSKAKRRRRKKTKKVSSPSVLSESDGE